MAAEEAGRAASDLQVSGRRVSTRIKTPARHCGFLMEQMSAKKGLRRFSQKGADALMKELQQHIDWRVMHPRNATALSQSEKYSALKDLMFLKEKRCGKVKGRGYANGRKQRLYKSKEETSSPTVRVESLFLSSMIDAKEDCKVITCDIPGAFMQANIDEQLFLKFDRDLVELLIQVDPTYQPYITYKGKQPVLYMELDKALYGTLQAALLFWQKLSAFLIEKHGLEWNEYDWCIVNKMIEGKQCTIAWYVNDIKMSHAQQEVLEGLLTSLNEEFGKEAPLTVTRGKVHDYVGMTFDYTIPGKVEITMPDFVQGVLDECPEDLMKGPLSTPTVNHLFNMDPECNKLSEKKQIVVPEQACVDRSTDRSVVPDDMSSGTR